MQEFLDPPEREAIPHKHLNPSLSRGPTYRAAPNGSFISNFDDPDDDDDDDDDPDCPFSSLQVQALVSPTCEATPSPIGSMIRSPTTPALMQHRPIDSNLAHPPDHLNWNTENSSAPPTADEIIGCYFQERHSPPPTPMSPMDALRKLQGTEISIPKDDESAKPVDV